MSHLKAHYRMRDLPDRTGLSKSFIYAELAAGRFPPGRWIAENVRVWTEEEIAAEMERRFELYDQAARG